MQLILKGFCDIIKDKYIGSQYFFGHRLPIHSVFHMLPLCFINFTRDMHYMHIVRYLIIIKDKTLKKIHKYLLILLRFNHQKIFQL